MTSIVTEVGFVLGRTRTGVFEKSGNGGGVTPRANLAFNLPCRYYVMGLAEEYHFQDSDTNSFCKEKKAVADRGGWLKLNVYRTI